MTNAKWTEHHQQAKPIIVAVHLNNNISGSPRVLADYIEVLSEEGYRIDLFTNRGNGPLLEVPAQFYDTGFQWLSNKYLSHLNYFISQAKLFFRLLRYRHSDALFLVNTMLPFGAALAGRCIRKPVVYIVHETMVRPILFKQFCKAMISYTATHVIYVSLYTQRSEQIKKIPSSIIYPTISKNIAAAAQNHTFSIPEQCIVSMISSIQLFKGNREFFEIAKRCVNNSQIRFELLISATSEEIDHLFPFESRPPNVTIFSEQPNPADFLSRATVFLNLTRPSEVTETFGLTILEALNFGIPCIVPPVGGPLELIDNEQNGLCIDSSEVSKITDAITVLCQSPERLKKYSSRAYQKALQFSPEQFKSRVIQFFHSQSSRADESK